MWPEGFMEPDVCKSACRRLPFAPGELKKSTGKLARYAVQLILLLSAEKQYQ